MKLGVAEILKKVSEIKNKTERAQALQQYTQNAGVMTIIKYAYDPYIKWDLPEGAPPYKESKLNDLEGRLYAEIRRLYLFLEGGHETLKKVRKEALFIELLESVTPDDAKLLIAAKDKKLPYKGLTEAFIREALPGLLADVEVATKEKV